MERKYATDHGRRTVRQREEHAALLAQRERLQERLMLLTNRIDRLQFCPHGTDVVNGVCTNCAEG